MAAACRSWTELCRTSGGIKRGAPCSEAWGRGCTEARGRDVPRHGSGGVPRHVGRVYRGTQIYLHHPAFIPLLAPFLCLAPSLLYIHLILFLTALPLTHWLFAGQKPNFYYFSVGSQGFANIIKYYYRIPDGVFISASFLPLSNYQVVFRDNFLTQNDEFLRMDMTNNMAVK